MNQEENSSISWIVACVLVIAIVGTLYALKLAHDTVSQAPQAFNGIADNVFIDDCPVSGCEMPTAGIVTIGSGLSTRVVATSTGRLYLEVSNTATTSPGQVLYCNTNDRPAVIGQGFAIFASSTRTFTNLRGSLNCRYQSSTSSVAFVEK
jgi:hypothetical protein